MSRSGHSEDTGSAKARGSDRKAPEIVVLLTFRLRRQLAQCCPSRCHGNHDRPRFMQLETMTQKEGRFIRRGELEHRRKARTFSNGLP